MPLPHDHTEDTSSLRNPSRTARLLRLFLILSSSLVLACGACCLLSPFLLGRKLGEGPAETAAAAAQITHWTLPPGFEGKSSAKIDNFLLKLEIIKIGQQQGRGLIILAQLHPRWFPVPDQEAQLKSIVEQASPELKVLKVERSRLLTCAINNRPAEFRIEQGEDLASTTRLRQVTGSFRSPEDNALLILQCEEEILSDEQIDEFLRSIQ